MFRIVTIALLAALAFAGASCGAPAQQNRPSTASNLSSGQLTIFSGDRRHQFTIELADTDEERQIGLMFRTELAEGAGMLFDFGGQPEPRSMWMKNTLIPLDMAFIDETGVIRRIAADTTPRSLDSISSGAPVSAVLEVAGGTFARLGVAEGDRVEHPLFDRR